MYRERLGGIKGMRPAESLGPISLFQGSTFLDVPRDFVVRTIRPAGSRGTLSDLMTCNVLHAMDRRESALNL
jgi:hypothetical protein